MNTITTIVQKLWHLKSYFQQQVQWSTHIYLTELTWLLGLKLAPQLENFLPLHLRWEELIRQPEINQLTYYQTMLHQLAQLDIPYFSMIYTQANTQLQTIGQLHLLIDALSSLDQIPLEDLGEIYESLLQYSAQENNECIIPPHALVDMMVILTQPQPGELVLDPLASVGSLLVAADQYITVMCEDDYDLVHLQTVVGIEPELRCHRLALMNCLLHQVVMKNHPPISWDDCLVSEQDFPMAEVILSSLLTPNMDYEIGADLIQYSIQQLKPNGRAALIVSDEMLQLSYFKQEVCPKLLRSCVLHTVLRLPIGIFYPHPVKAYLLFFRHSPHETTQQIYFYDLRHQLPSFSPRYLLTREHLIQFEMEFGDDPYGKTTRNTQYWHCLHVNELVENNLDIFQIEDTMITSVFPSSDILDSTLNELEDIRQILQNKT